MNKSSFIYFPFCQNQLPLFLTLEATSISYYSKTFPTKPSLNSIQNQATDLLSIPLIYSLRNRPKWFSQRSEPWLCEGLQNCLYKLVDHHSFILLSSVTQDSAQNQHITCSFWCFPFPHFIVLHHLPCNHYGAAHFNTEMNFMISHLRNKNEVYKILIDVNVSLKSGWWK